MSTNPPLIKPVTYLLEEVKFGSLEGPISIAQDPFLIEDACRKINNVLKETFTKIMRENNGRLPKSVIRFTFFIGSSASTVNECFSGYWEKLTHLPNSFVNPEVISATNIIYLTHIALQAKNLGDQNWNCRVEIGKVHIYEEDTKDAKCIQMRFLSIYLLPQEQGELKKIASIVYLEKEMHICNPALYLDYAFGFSIGKKTRISAEGPNNILLNHRFGDISTLGHGHL